MKPLVGGPPDRRRNEVAPAGRNVDLVVPCFPQSKSGTHLCDIVTIPSKNGRSVTNSHFKSRGFPIKLRRYAVSRATGWCRSCISAQMPDRRSREKLDGNGSPLLNFHQNTIAV
ncbi:hypothetical protein E0H38_13050 [Rhizobium leguminosarum bv. viciae]|nr:hypothetical protein [Rhizobium leguminosarum bv. viciae]NKM97600.1 hypothetical protein [Rhizobium leguminosarum bv. viciae]TBZ20470.1 hypothetical protein E0H38_13050 [Rhizobium leguminosarum bv. viciae]TCA11254.1 hypothetical protein E0H57_03575 [Rhizobium leguminosarum bv. viciae]